MSETEREQRTTEALLAEQNQLLREQNATVSKIVGHTALLVAVVIVALAIGAISLIFASAR